MSFKVFINKNILKNKATSNTKTQQVLGSIRLDIVGIFLRDGPLSSDIGIVKLHPSKRTHWVAYINEIYSDSYALLPPNQLSKFIIKRNGHCFSLNTKYNG